MQCFSVILVSVMAASIFIPECLTAVVIPSNTVHALDPVAQSPSSACQDALDELLAIQTTCIDAALVRKALARLAADEEKSEACNGTLTAATDAQLAVYLGKPGDVALAAILEAAIVTYQAIYVPAEAAHVISYNAADAACLIQITAAFAAYKTGVAAITPCV